MPLLIDQSIGKEVIQSGGGGGSFPNIENYVIVSDIATPETGKVYNTIADAITYINTLSLSASNKAIIHVYSKQDSSNFNIPQYCQVIGAREYGILTGVISTSGTLPLDANIFDYERYAGLINFDVQGSINFSSLSTPLEGNLYVKNCIINRDGGGIVTGNTYNGSFLAEDCRIEKLIYNSAIAFRINTSKVYYSHTINNATSSSKAVLFYKCDLQAYAFPEEDCQLTLTTATHPLSVICSSCNVNVVLLGGSISPQTTFVLSNVLQASYDDTLFSGIISKTNFEYLGNNNLGGASTLDQAIDYLETNKAKKVDVFNASLDYLGSDEILDPGPEGSVPLQKVTALTNISSGNPFDKTQWFHGAIAKTIVTSSPYTLGYSESLIYVDAGSSDITLNFPDFSSKSNKLITIVRVDSNLANKVRLGATTIYLRYPGESITLLFDKTNPSLYTKKIARSFHFTRDQSNITFGGLTNCSIVSTNLWINPAPENEYNNAANTWFSFKGYSEVSISAANTDSLMQFAIPIPGGGSPTPFIYSLTANIVDTVNPNNFAQIATRTIGSNIMFYFKPVSTNNHIIYFSGYGEHE